MRRFLALLASVIVVFVATAAPVAADTGAPATASSNAGSSPSSPNAIPSDAISLSPAQIAGSGLAVTLDAGASEEHDLVVSNHTANLRLTVKISASDATGNVGAATAAWLSFGDDAIQLDPHVATTVPMTIAVPHDTQPGSALAHVSATVESAVSAADGSPVAGSATAVIPVAVDVSGTPSAQIAIADVHRVDQGKTHQLAVVLRNFGAQGAQVSGHVTVAGDAPQTIPFHADLAASRDTTLDLDWNAPPAGTPSDIAVDLEYGGGNVASWSSQLGGTAANLSPTSATVSTPTTVSAPVALSTATGSAAPGKPLWKQPLVTLLAVLAVAAAALWFGVEMRASRRRREWVPQPARLGVLPGWGAGGGDDSIDLAKQLVRLTDVVVQLVESHRLGLDVAAERARARSPDAFTSARAGPEPPQRAPAQPPLPFDQDPEPPEVGAPEPATEIVRSPSPTPGASPRPEPVDPRVTAMARLTELDRQRRRLREWMDTEDSGVAIEPELGAPEPRPDA